MTPVESAMTQEERTAAHQLIAEVYRARGYVAARDATIDLLGRYVSPEGLRDIVELGAGVRW